MQSSSAIFNQTYLLYLQRSSTWIMEMCDIKPSFSWNSTLILYSEINEGKITRYKKMERRLRCLMLAGDCSGGVLLQASSMQYRGNWSGPDGKAPRSSLRAIVQPNRLNLTFFHFLKWRTGPEHCWTMHANKVCECKFYLCLSAHVGGRMWVVTTSCS